MSPRTGCRSLTMARRAHGCSWERCGVRVQRRRSTRRPSMPISCSAAAAAIPDRGRGGRARGHAGRRRGRARRPARSSRFTLYVLRPGAEARLSSATAARLMLMGGEAFPTRRYVFWNFVSSSRDRINQAKEDWKALRFPLVPGDDQEFIPLAGGPDDGQLPVIEIRRVGLSDRRHAQRCAWPAIRPDAPPSSCCMAFRNRTGPGARLRRGLEDDFCLVMPDQRGFAGSDRPQEVEAYKRGHPGRRHVRPGRCARPSSDFALVGHDWGGAIAWAGGAARRSETDPARHHQLAAPGHLPEEPDRGRRPARRLAIHHGLPRAWVREGGRARWASTAFFDKTLRQAMSTCRMIPEAEKRQYLADWSQPGALAADAQLVSRFSRLVVPPPGVTVPLPDWLLRAFPPGPGADTRHLGDGGHGAAAAPARRTGRTGRRPDGRSTAERRPFRAVGGWRRRRCCRSGTSLPSERRLGRSRMSHNSFPFPFRRPPRRRPGALPAGDGGHAAAPPAPGIPRPPARRDASRTRNMPRPSSTSSTIS